MRSEATTVEGYLVDLPPARREALEAVRGVILELDDLPLDLIADTIAGLPLDAFSGVSRMRAR